MKIDRLLGITVFLLNRDKVSCSILAEKFEVSHRTIQRDMEALNRAGIPVVSTFGADGGYQILDSFKMERQVAGRSDYSFILTALKGLSTAYSSPEIDSALEKMMAVTNKHTMDSNIFLDFGVLREAEDINGMLRLLEKAISDQMKVSFYYTNAQDAESVRTIEPIALTYKWHSWYMFAFCETREEYRFFKLIRMRNLKETQQPFLREHEYSDILLEKYGAVDHRKYIDFKLFCHSEIKVKVMEYLHGRIEKEYENGDCVLHFHVPEEEHLWFGTLLALGNKVKVLEPDDLKERLCAAAKEIWEMYGIYDT